MKSKPAITQELLVDRFYYDEKSGFFYERSFETDSFGSPVGHAAKNLYIKVSIQGYPFLAHRLAWIYMNGTEPIGDIDHIDGDRQNNAWSNMREGTRSQNLQNRRSASCTKQSCNLLGAFWSKPANRWRSQIRANGKTHHLGLFDTALEAHQAYLNAKRRLHEFCEI